MKLQFKNQVMLLLLLAGSFIVVGLSAMIWNYTPVIGAGEQAPAWCRDVVLVSNVAWLVTCVVFIKRPAIYPSQIIRAAGLRMFWPGIRFYNVIALRWRLVLGAILIIAGGVALCSYTMLPMYSSTCTVRDFDDGTLIFEFLKRHPDSVFNSY